MAILGFALTEAIALLYETTRAYWVCLGYLFTYQIVEPNYKSLGHRGISNNIYLIIERINYKLLFLLNKKLFCLKWLGFKPKSYLQTKITKSMVDSRFWYKIAEGFECNNLIQKLIYPQAWSVARRHMT
jgi:hypothetical protein